MAEPPPRVITEQAMRVAAALRRLDDVHALVTVPTPEGGRALDFSAPPVPLTGDLTAPA